MKRPKDDRASLWDIREAVFGATAAIAGVGLDAFLANDEKLSEKKN